MANTLLIEKETGGYYGFTLTIDGVVQDKIRNMFNDAFGKNNLVTINNSTGANLVKKQNISVFDITLIASGTFTFSDIDAFLVKLIDIGFFDWRLGTGGGGGATRFDDLLDTFQYFGQDGKGVKVNESEQKLETYDIYNYRTITDLEDTYDVGVPNKMLVTDNDGNVVLEDKIVIPQPFLNSIGSITYADVATQTTPLIGVANVELKLLNDINGTGTDFSNAPYGIVNLWDSTPNELDFAQLSIGDTVNLRTTLKVTTSTSDQNINVYARLGLDTASEIDLLIGSKFIKTAGEFTFESELSFVILKPEHITAMGELYLISEHNSTVKVQDFRFITIRKNINVIDIDGLTDLSATRTASNVTIESSTGTPAVIGLGNGTNAGFSLNDYTSAEKSKLAGISTGANVGVVPNTAITGATKTKITYDSKGLVTSGSDLIESDIPTLGQTKITNLTTDLGLKAPLASPTFTGVPLAPTATVANNTTQIATTAFVSTATTNAVAGKMNTPSGTVNFLSKFLTASTIGLSRIFDNGTFLGIGTVNTPTKDITFRNDSSKEIGVEDSNSVTTGNNLIVSGGRAINFITTADYTSLNQASRSYRGIAVATNSNVYVVENGGSIYMQTAGTGNFNNLSQTARGWYDVAVHSNGNVYATVYTGDIYMQTAGTGNFVALGQTSRGWTGIAVAPNGNVYATTYDTGDIYMQTAGTGNFVALSQTLRNWRAITVAPNGNVYATVDGDIYMQTAGTGNFVALSQTSRLWYGIASDSNGNIYATVNGGSIYKQTAGTGNFVTLNQTSRNWFGIDCATNSNNVYSSVFGGDIYIQTNEALGIPDLNGGTLKLYSGTGKGTGASDIELHTGQKTTSGTNMQVLTLRAKINNEGLMTLPSVTNALILAEATGKAIATKEFVEAKQIQRLAQYTVATLPTGAQGDLAYVTDALLPTYLGTAVGGGAVVCKVFFNGTNWIT